MRSALLALAVVFALAVLGLLLARYGIPNLVGSGQAFAGTHAVSMLRIVHWGEGIFREGRYEDADRDGVGEFGSVGQLAGAEPSEPGHLPSSLLELPGQELQGDILRAGGYCFRVDLPAGADERERRFTAFAWPQAIGAAGTQVYCLDQDENVFEAESGAVGCDKGPPPGSCPDPSVPTPGWKRWRNKTSTNPAGAP